MTKVDDTITTIKFSRDRLGMVDWAFLPDSIFALARFDDGAVFLVAHPFKARKGNDAGETFIRINNAKYEHAETFAAFKRLAVAFQNDGKETG